MNQWPQELRDKPKIYLLMEPVEALAERLGHLTQLTSLHLCGNAIGAEERRPWLPSANSAGLIFHLIRSWR